MKFKTFMRNYDPQNYHQYDFKHDLLHDDEMPDVKTLEELINHMGSAAHPMAIEAAREIWPEYKRAIAQR